MTEKPQEPIVLSTTRCTDETCKDKHLKHHHVIPIYIPETGKVIEVDTSPDDGT